MIIPMHICELCKKPVEPKGLFFTCETPPKMRAKFGFMENFLSGFKAHAFHRECYRSGISGHIEGFHGDPITGKFNRGSASGTVSASLSSGYPLMLSLLSFLFGAGFFFGAILIFISALNPNNSNADFLQIAASPLIFLLGILFLARWIAYSRVLLLNMGIGRQG
jgi:hypothetical protein